MTTKDQKPNEPNVASAAGWSVRLLLGADVALWLLFVVCYASRADVVAAITVFPPWCWLAPGLGLWLLDWRSPRAVWWAVGGAWLVFAVVNADAPGRWLAMLRTPGFGYAMPSLPDPIHVVTLNCGGVAPGEIAADLVLLQETPGRESLGQLARTIGGEVGGFAASSDTAIVSRWPIRRLTLDAPIAYYFTAADVEIPVWGDASERRTWRVVSVRLEPYPVRFDYWRLACWREYTAVRRRQREQLVRLMDALVTLPPVDGLLVGGDMNAPPGDAIFRRLLPTLRDTFVDVGIGWGATLLNDPPLLRIDQIWLDQRWSALRVEARRSRASDHRQVDAWIARRPRAP